MFHNNCDFFNTCVYSDPATVFRLHVVYLTGGLYYINYVIYYSYISYISELVLLVFTLYTKYNWTLLFI